MLYPMQLVLVLKIHDSGVTTRLL